MNRPVKITSRPQLALQSYLDSLLQDVTEELDAASRGGAPRRSQPKPCWTNSRQRCSKSRPAMRRKPSPSAGTGGASGQGAGASKRRHPLWRRYRPSRRCCKPGAATVEAQPAAVEVHQALVPPVVEVHLPPSNTPPPVETDGRPSWAAEPFECLLFDVAGLTLAVPLVCLGSIYSLAGHELTPLFGQPEWFLGILPSQAGNLKVLDTARWVMPDRYRDDFKQGLQYVISVQGYEWGLAVHQVSRSLRLDPNEIKWRSHRGQRPWLAGTVIEHMCALLDVASLAELIASGGARHMSGSKPGHKPTSVK